MTKPLELVTEAPTENQIRNAIANYLTFHHWLVLRINSGAVTAKDEKGKKRWFWFVKWQLLGADPLTRGVSDLLALHPDYPPLSIETKVPGKVATVEQKRFQAEWVKHGGIAVVASSIEDVEQVIINNSIQK